MSDGKLEQIRHREIAQRRRSVLYQLGLGLAILTVVIALAIAARSIVLVMHG